MFLPNTPVCLVGLRAHILSQREKAASVGGPEMEVEKPQPAKRNTMKELKELIAAKRAQARAASNK